MSQTELKSQSIEAIIVGCRDESQQPRARECGFCFELFRRALEERTQAAWAAIGRQYQRLLLAWVGEARDADPEHLAGEALERFWRTLAGRPEPLASRFEHIGALLRYLRQCAVSTLLDHQRQQQRLQRLRERVERDETLEPHTAPERSALEQLCREEQVRGVRAWLRDHVTDPIELRVLELSYDRDLSPVQIVERHPDEFPDVQVVRRIKERILRRMKRAMEESGPENAPRAAEDTTGRR